MSGTKSIVHDQEQSRFVIYVDDQEAGFAEYVQEGNVRDFNHTVVDPEFRGQGLSKPLISEALLETKEAGLKIKASCSAVEAFAEKNPEFKELLA
ncbi:GNAT family N-acetyltransferase [uncultured Corynebacterium sp.]|uniref:GNAT family N-acetyltransferase n=1 Tax=uncultured Corynebacterium sp. TaxID=159447 RepID=UPI0025FD7D4D|nr:GNAT family N-acetyltransferase [uncultured Corynebacterium sp.]